MLDDLSAQEVALLLATKASENAQSLVELAQNAEAPIASAASAVDALVDREILEEIDSHDGIRYGFAGNDVAQSVYDEIYGPPDF